MGLLLRLPRLFLNKPVNDLRVDFDITWQHSATG
jgi:hypothetical protein